MALARDHGGSGRPLLVLIHGLGATRRVWDALIPQIETSWSGRWAAYDLPGHGQSPAARDYSLWSTAAAVGDEISQDAGGGPVILLGHSLGAAVALALASGWADLRPRQVLGLGLKSVWSEAEVEALARRAGMAPRRFETRKVAIDTFLRVCGLGDLVDPAGPIAASGVRREGAGFRLAMDPRANGVGPPPMARLTAAAVTSVAMACGALDSMADAADLRRWIADVEVLPGLGHNAMVEGPERVWRWASERLQMADADA